MDHVIALGGWSLYQHLTLTFLWMTFLNFQTSSWPSCTVNAITTEELHALCSNYTDVIHIKFSSKFDVYYCLTFLNFWTSWRSNGWQVTTPCKHNNCYKTLPASYCNFNRDVLHIKILQEFNIDLCVTFLNFQTSSWPSYMLCHFWHEIFWYCRVCRWPETFVSKLTWFTKNAQYKHILPVLVLLLMQRRHCVLSFIMGIMWIKSHSIQYFLAMTK